VATLTGAHSDRVARVRDLQSAKGRKEHRRFSFEGPTLLAEARRSAVPIEELYVTRGVYERLAEVRELEATGTPVFLVDDRTAAKISDLETPPGLLAVAPVQLATPEAAAASPLTLVLADLNDPGNVGTLLRSAEAFGAGGAILGRLGVDPYHPKVVRGSMGAIFRLALAVAAPDELWGDNPPPVVLGLVAEGPDIVDSPRAERIALIVGHERRGLGNWAELCSAMTGVPMAGVTESLNAAVAGSIALYALRTRLSRESSTG
jgi:TrmH family RNA methyltransferase